MSSNTPPVPPPPLMARVGRGYFERRSSRLKAVSSGDALHVLNPEERAALRRVERWALIRSGLAGALSGGACAAAEVFADGQWSGDLVKYWAFIGVVTIIASVAEIAFISFDTLRSVHELARVAGLELFGKSRSSSDEALVDALARAALELPNPVHAQHGVNPHREAKKWRLVMISLAYKAKVGVTNFVAKLLIRRVLGRVLVRGALRFLPFVSLPVTAMWNAIVTWRVLREARLRAMGPSAVEELTSRILSGIDSFSSEGRLAAMRAVASAIVRTQDLHPNLVRLLECVSQKVGTLGPDELDDVGLFLSTLPKLAPGERTAALQLLAVACIIDGRLSAREEQLWVDAATSAGKSASLEGLDRLRLAFVRGDPFEPQLQAL